jgi:hypothetical protein
MENLLNEQSAGNFLGGMESPISTRSMQRHRQQGTGPTYIKVGRLVRYRESDLVAFLEERVCTSTWSLEPSMARLN